VGFTDELNVDGVEYELGVGVAEFDTMDEVPVGVFDCGPMEFKVLEDDSGAMDWLGLGIAPYWP